MLLPLLGGGGGLCALLGDGDEEEEDDISFFSPLSPPPFSFLVLGDNGLAAEKLELPLKERKQIIIQIYNHNISYS